MNLGPPDYEIKEWNESNFDVYANAYVEEAYRLKKYAFVSDYARFLVLYKYGGIYFDIDVEVLKPLMMASHLISNLKIQEILMYICFLRPMMSMKGIKDLEG